MMERPRILLVNYEFPPIGGGAGTATAGLAAALVGLGCDVVVLTSRFRGQPAREPCDGYVVQRVRVMRRHADRSSPVEMLTFMVSAALGALRLTRQWRPDLTIAFFGIPGGPVAYLLRLWRRVPYIISLRGGDVPGFIWAPGVGIYHRLTLPIIRFLWRRARAVVANGAGLQQLAERALPELHVPVIPNGVDAEQHAPAADTAARAHTAPRLLLLGRLVHQKGADLLLRALAELRDLPWALELAGDGPERAPLAALARELALSERVHFAGWIPRDQLAQHFRAADVFALPSRIEGMPNVVLEAMAYALPVVATNVPGNSDLIRSEDTGLLVPADDVPALAAALRRMLQDAALRARLGAAARRHVLSQHSWQQSATAYLQLGGMVVPNGETDARALATAAPLPHSTETVR